MLKGFILIVGLTASILMPVSAQGAEVVEYESERHAFRVVTLAEGLVHPWSLAFLPDGDLLISERSGRLRLLRDGVLLPDPLQGVPAVASKGQGGLLDIALDPAFATNGLLYLSYAGKGRGGMGTEVLRARLVDQSLVDHEVIFSVEPKSSGGRHYGSRLVFGREGNLFVTLGERGDPDRAQDLGDLAGSVARIRPDGSVPPDNPFAGDSNGFRPEIFTYGHRNPQGLAWHPETGDLWAVEHGPKGGDELNVLESGRNYGWPVITHGRSYAGFKIGIGTAKAGMEQPVRHWVPSISPSGMAFYMGAEFPGWQGNLFIGALSGRLLVRLELDNRSVTHEERLLETFGERIRDVRLGPDGRLYLLTDSRNGALLRLEPSE